MSTHTQGQWLYDIKGTQAIIVEEDGCTVVDLTVCENTTGHSMFEKNVRMFAKSPELIKALEALMKQAAKDAESYAPNGNEAIWAYIADAADVIAKARGQE